MSDHDFQRLQRSMRYLSPALKRSVRLVLVSPPLLKPVAKVPLKLCAAIVSAHVLCWKVVHGL